MLRSHGDHMSSVVLKITWCSAVSTPQAALVQGRSGLARGTAVAGALSRSANVQRTSQALARNSEDISVLQFAEADLGSRPHLLAAVYSVENPEEE